jgi:hypothetical protein
MVRFNQIAWCRGIVAAILVLTALSTAQAVDKDAMAVAPPPSQFEPTAPRQTLLDPNLFKAHRYGANDSSRKVNVDKFQKESSGITLPTRIDLGGSTLRLDTDRSAINNGPRVGIDSTDLSTQNPGLPTKKDATLAPNYFGLTITTPTH